MIRCGCGSYNVIERLRLCLRCAERIDLSRELRVGTTLGYVVPYEVKLLPPKNGYRKRTREEKIAEYAEAYGGTVIHGESEAWTDGFWQQFLAVRSLE